MKILGEEKSALAISLKLFPKLNQATTLIKDALMIVIEAKTKAEEVVRLANSNNEKEAYHQYKLLVQWLLNLPIAIVMTKEALEIMEGALRPLRGVENYTKDAFRKLGRAPMPLQKKESTEERGIFSLSKNVESGMRLNIQRCEAIKGHLEGIVKGWKDIPLQSLQGAGFVRVSAALCQELENVRMYYMAAFNAMHVINSVVIQVANLEGAAIKQELASGAKA